MFNLSVGILKGKYNKATKRKKYISTVFQNGVYCHMIFTLATTVGGADGGAVGGAVGGADGGADCPAVTCPVGYSKLDDQQISPNCYLFGGLNDIRNWQSADV